MDTLMNSIDDIKEKLTDMEYKTLCDQMAVIHKAKDTMEGCYELKFARFVPRIETRGMCVGESYTYNIKIQTLIIKTNCDMFLITRMKHKIEESGSYSMNVGDLKDIVGDGVEANVLWNEYMEGHEFVTRHAKYNDDDDDDEGPIESVETSHIYLQKANSVPVISIKML
jgi:hypothetical protein